MQWVGSEASGPCSLSPFLLLSSAGPGVLGVESSGLAPRTRDLGEAMERSLEQEAPRISQWSRGCGSLQCPLLCHFAVFIFLYQLLMQFSCSTVPFKDTLASLFHEISALCHFLCLNLFCYSLQVAKC